MYKVTTPQGTKHSLVFQHIPKTAGSTIIHTVLGGEQKRFHINGERHFKLCTLQETIGKEALDEAFSFSIIREPLSRFLSSIRWQLNLMSKGNPPDRPIFIETYDPNILVDHLVENVDEFSDHFIYWPQVDYLRCDGSKIDFVGKQEHLDDAMNYLIYGVIYGRNVFPDVKLNKRVNDSSHQVIPEITERNIKRVLDYYKEDVEFYNTFTNPSLEELRKKFKRSEIEG